MKSISSTFARYFLLILFIISIVDLVAQENKFLQKLSPLISEKNISGDQKKLYRVFVTVKADAKSFLPEKFIPFKIEYSDSFKIYSLWLTDKELKEEIIPLNYVVFAEPGERNAKEELMIGNMDLSVNKINVAQRIYPQYSGAGLTVSIKENKPDTADIDIKGRFVSSSIASSTVSSHASIMSTMIAGAGNSWHLGKGAAPAALVTSSDFANLMPDDNASIQQLNISVQNNSYGVGIENFYAPDATAYDARLISNPNLIDIFSSGNSGTSASTTGTYSGITGFANLTGSFKMAKNIITVGATDSFHNVAALSSKGPAYDGRIKPELVAYGIDGSSGSAALVSGVALLLQQQFKTLNGSLPSNALVKAVLLNSADDAGNKEVDYSNGFGSLNAMKALKTFQSARFFNASVNSGGSQNFSITIPAGIKKLKTTLTWNDPPAAINASKALVNDLDLEVKNTGTNETWLPWVLSKFPHIDSLRQPATRKRDSLNNVEQVTIDNPAAGIYSITVKATATSSSQNFSVAWQLDSTAIFEWVFPVSQDAVYNSSLNTLRWNSTYVTNTGKLEFSTDNGNNWQVIHNSVNLLTGFLNWNAPSTISTGLLRMTIDNNAFTSDTFVLSTRTPLFVGFNCPDSFLFYWNKTDPTIPYRLYKLGYRYLEPLLITADSFIILKKDLNPSLYYAVAPIINSREGMKSYTLNHTIQGVECYIRSFIATLVNDAVSLDLSLGTLYNIRKIVLEKFDGQSFRPVRELSNINNLLVNFMDNDLSKGMNIYRIKIELPGGVVYSTTESIFYFKASNYVIFPNPAAKNGGIKIAQQNVDYAVMQVFNSTGQKVFEKILDDRINTIPAGILPGGVYILKFQERDGWTETGKLIVF